ncbi:zingipain-2-like [Dorcoceras hygrometricum]|uniref:Zingipain-2-like n=1 Tax=Dorcoceras hygrometricum TaxID=472368 RepID=A0A2Z7CNZ2_9LAMI|nr:zingipain-2-like [Dorcoceras hygrometricum]
MASSLLINTSQVDVTSVLTMEHAGMVRMFKTLEDTGLHGFLEGTTPIFESVVLEFFSNARVIAGTIFGPQCPTSPLLPPRKDPLEDLIYTMHTDPIPQPAAARTPRLYQPTAVHSLVLRLSSSSRYADVMVAESRYLSISNADVIFAARSFFQLIADVIIADTSSC